MKKQIVRISKLQIAKVTAVIYLVISLPMVLLTSIPVLIKGGSFPWYMLLLFPILYTVLGFVFTLIGAAIYNLVAARIGGIEFTTAEVAES